MVEETDPTDWADMWAWIDGEWLRVRKESGVFAIPSVYIVEEWEHPGKLYTVELVNCRRGDKPTEPPEPTQ